MTIHTFEVSSTLTNEDFQKTINFIHTLIQHFMLPIITEQAPIMLSKDLILNSAHLR